MVYVDESSQFAFSRLSVSRAVRVCSFCSLSAETWVSFPTEYEFFFRIFRAMWVRAGNSGARDAARLCGAASGSKIFSVGDVLPG